MKPTPTPEMEAAWQWYKAASEKTVVSKADFCAGWNAALSVQPAAAVVGEPVAWPIDTDDQVEALARECEWDNRKYMTPADYTIWCERMRKFARLAAPSAPDGWQPDAGQQWRLDRIGEEIAAGRKQNALTYLSCVFAETASRISQQDAELDRLRREVEEARQVAEDRLSDNARLTNEKADALFALAEARKAAFIEAAEIAEKVAAGQDQEWRTDTAMRVAYALRAKAEETRT